MKNELGKVTKQNDGFQVRFERVLNHDIQTVWDAITHPEKLKIWFTDIEMDFRPGGNIKIAFRDENKTVSGGKIIRIDPPHKFEYTWEDELAVWELEELNKGQCKLKLTYSKLPDEYAVNAPAGFHTLLDRLEKMLAGSTEQYPFGTESTAPEHLKMQELYETPVYREYPELKRHKPVVIEKVMDATVERVWQAITDREQMKEWYFDLEVFEPKVGFEFQFVGKGLKGQEYLHLCKITEVVPLAKLQYSWSYKGYDGKSFVTFELSEQGQKTLLRLTHSHLGSFPEEIADFARENFVMGWTELIGSLLKKHVEQ